MDGAAEVWRDVPGFPGYQASNLGQVRSCRGWGGGTRAARLTDHWRTLGFRTNRGGYAVCALQLGGRRARQCWLVHRLIATVFLPPPRPGQTDVRHLDGNRTNNAVSNLAWGTRLDNERDKDRHGRRRFGERHQNAKLTEVQVREVVSLRESGLRQREIGERLGIPESTVNSILTGQSWRTVTGRGRAAVG